jgi:hypothetical protein
MGRTMLWGAIGGGLILGLLGDSQQSWATPGPAPAGPEQWEKQLRRRMLECAVDGAVAVEMAKPVTISCHHVNTPATCNQTAGELLAADRDYPYTRCRQHTDSRGRVCPAGPPGRAGLSYRGTCTSIGKTCGCGRRIKVDIFGQVVTLPNSNV